MKKRIFFWMMGCLLNLAAQAQHQAILDEFRREAGDQSALFIGKIEWGYSPVAYINHPYWEADDFVFGDIIYRGVAYREVLMRFDAYLQQLVVKSPERKTNVWLEMPSVEKFVMKGTEFARRNGEFMGILFSSSRLELVEQLHVSVKDVFSDKGKVQYRFEHDRKFLVLRDGQTYEVDKLKSVMKVFPEWKKELKWFAKTHKLNFKVHRQSSLITVIKYVDELLAQSVN